MEGKEDIKKTASHTEKVNKEAEEISRVFAAAVFGSAEFPDRKIEMKKIGAFDEVIRDAEKEHGALHFEGARKIIECFAKARVPHTLPDGKTIMRKPHLMIAGGFVRDILLHKKPKDVDFATSLSYAEVAELLQKSFSQEIADGAMTFAEVGKNFGILFIRFSGTGEQYEIASFRLDGDYKDGRRPEDITTIRHAGPDADRRDLTINALFYNPLSGNVIDYVGGLRDIQDKKLRFVGEPEQRIAEDRSRMLRYVRFLLRTGFAEDGRAMEAIKKNAEKIQETAVETVRDEMNKILQSGPAGEALKMLKKYELLQYILPEVDRLSLCTQGPPYHMEGDVFEHTVMVANALPPNAPLMLRWAAILHDIAKPDTKEDRIDEAGKQKISFIGHAEPGAEKAMKILENLHFSNEQKKEVEWPVQNHIRIFEFPILREGKAREMALSPYFLNLFELAKADTRSSVPTDTTIREENEKNIVAIEVRYRAILEFEKEKKSEIFEVRKAVNGNIIKEKYHAHYGVLPEDALIGIMQREVLEMLTNEKITDTNEALRVLGGTIIKYPPDKTYGQKRTNKK